MNTLTHNNKNSIEQVGALLTERLPKVESNSLQQLAQAFLGNPTAQLPKDAEDQYGALLCVWDLLQQRHTGDVLVRVYNTDPQQHRWHSNHSIVELLLDDMNFITASVTNELARAGIRIHQISHPVLNVERSAAGQLIALHEKASDKTAAEACLRLEIDRQQEKAELATVEAELKRVLTDVRSAVQDQPQMLQRMGEAAAWLEQQEEAENAAFLRWLAGDNFLLLGYRYYDLKENNDGCCDLIYQPGSGLGNFAEPVSDDQALIRLNAEQSRLARQCESLVLTKSTSRTTVQRDAHLDYVGVKRVIDGRVRGEWRFFGLYNASAYDTPADQVPLLRRKIQQMLDQLDLPQGSYSDKELREVLQQYPRDEMLQTSDEALEQTALGMLASIERRSLAVFLRPDHHDRFIKVLLLIPRDQFNTAVRQKIRQILLQEFDGHSAEFGVRLSEKPLMMLQFTIHCHKANEKRLDVARLTDRIKLAMTSWQERLHQSLLQRLPEAEANRLFRRFSERLPAAYRDDTLPGRAVSDLLRLGELTAAEPMQSYLYQTVESRDEVHFRVLGLGGTMALSDVLPILEQMGVRVLSATPYQLADSGEDNLWLLDFRLEVAQGLDMENSSLRSQFQQSFRHAYAGRIENDGFNRLVISAGLSWQQVIMLRALCKYLLQLGVPFSQHYMEQTLVNNSRISALLVKLFEQRFDPAKAAARDSHCAELVAQIEAALDKVDNLDEDRILRHYLTILQATLRTNFYQADKDYVSFKINTSAIEFAPEPRPAFEIFVYAPYVEGVHLRAGKVARGGLRWSDRREDFRTEVLGLVKAQMVKNAVIVPVGAKGGFVPKQLPQGDREAMLAEGIRCYKTFIRGLLDITDNRRGDEIVPPQNLVRHDEDDPYLVVAADKGTATFSDIANGISAEYGFWLGDAFASGGSNGYDHKGMGITARGAWESVKRLFNEQNIDCQNQDFSVVGVGDMAGDVFGNGMLLSKKIRLVAAFNHLHIFIDPNPDAASSWEERNRLFNLPRSSWEDYDTGLISEGGGIYARSAKSITLSSQACAALGLEKNRMTPNELINAILKAPVDLLWNGGIGTYVKATEESHADVGDRANEAVRIDAPELRAKVVGEGGNLGLTQRARIEIARNGGLINSDAIDNAGGVDCSDHEVNLKILLGRQVENQDMTEKQRNTLLESMTDEVAALVLKHNYQQSQILSLCATQAAELINDHRRLIQGLEQAGRLNRELEYLPDDEQLELLAREGQGMSRPEIAVLMAYSKLWLFDQLIEAGVGEDTDLAAELPAYFPSAIRENMAEQLQQHPLRSELIATHITNLSLNRMGSTFISYLQAETRCSALDAVRAFFAASRIMGIPAIWTQLEALEGKIDDSLFRAQLIRIQDLLEEVSVWLLRRNAAPLSISALEQQFSSAIAGIAAQLPTLLGAADAEALQRKTATLVSQEIPAELAEPLAALDYLYYGLDIAQLATAEQPVIAAAAAYFGLKQALNLNSLQQLVGQLPVDDLWSRKARATLRNELDALTAQVSADLLSRTEATLPVSERLALWQDCYALSLQQFRLTLDEIALQAKPNLAMMSVAVRELNNLNAA